MREDKERVAMGYEYEIQMGSPDPFGGQIVRREWRPAPPEVTEAVIELVRAVNAARADLSIQDRANNLLRMWTSLDRLRETPEGRDLIGDNIP